MRGTHDYDSAEPYCVTQLTKIPLQSEEQSNFMSALT